MPTLIAAVFLTVGLTVTCGFAFVHYQNREPQKAILWGLAAWLCAGVGLAAVAWDKFVSDAPQAQTTASSGVVPDWLKDHGDAQLRPYLGVSGVTATMEIGKPVSVVIKFTNNGATPAEDAEIRAILEKLPVGQPLNRRYDGAGFERVSRTSINRGNTAEAEVVSRDENTVQLLTVEDLMQLNTDRTHYLAAHGVVRYRSKYIPGGSEETPFCYEFEPLSGQWIVCRVEAKRKGRKSQESQPD